jgi:hypothetical protein
MSSLLFLALMHPLQVSSSQSECASLLARGDIEFIDAILNFDPNGTPYASASDMFVQVKLLNENSDVLSCFQYGGYDFETTECGIAGKWPTEWGTTLGTYRYTANVSKVSASGENWFICVGNGWTQASGSVSYSGQLIFPPSLTYDIPSTSSPSLLPSLSPTRSPTLTSTATTSPSRTPTLSPSSSHPTVTLSPTSDPIYLNADCDAPLFIEYNAQLSGGQSVCIDFGANGSFSTFSLQLNFTGSSSNSEKASDFGFVLYSTHFHTGVQYGGYNYYLDNVDYISGWPESWNSRVSGSYLIEDQVVNINPSFNINGDYYRLCIFNGWSSASKATYVGSIDLSNSLHLNCDVIEPDLTPTLTPTPQPTVTLGPTSVTDRGIYLSPLSSHPLDPLTFLFDVNLTSAGYLCSPAIPSTGYLTSISTVFDFTPANEISWASDLLVTIRMLPSDSSTAGEECVVVGGEDVDSQSTCQTPQAVYSWSSKALESNHEGTYNATVELTGWTTDPATYQVRYTSLLTSLHWVTHLITSLFVFSQRFV